MRPDLLVEFVLEEFAERAGRDVDGEEMAAFSLARYVDDEPSVGAAWLRERGEKPDVEDKLWRASDAARVTERVSKARYAKSAKGMATYERWKARLRKRTAMRLRQRRYAARNPGLGTQRQRDYASRNIEIVRARARAYYEANREEQKRKALVRRRLALGWTMEEATTTPARAKRKAA